MGHKFWDRTHGIKEDERSPVFLQFLDAVHQLQVQYPMAFEWNQWLLVALTDFLYSNAHTDFMYNSLRERDLAESSGHQLSSCWSLIKMKAPVEFLNRNYVSGRAGVLKPLLDRPLCVWTSYFRRWAIAPIDGNLLHVEESALTIANVQSKSSVKPNSNKRPKSDDEFLRADTWSVPALFNKSCYRRDSAILLSAYSSDQILLTENF